MEINVNTEHKISQRFMDDLKKNYEKLAASNQYIYMKEVKRCALRENNKCGKTSSCELCKHYVMVREAWDKFKKMKLDENGRTTEPILHIEAGFRAADIEEYLKGFDIEFE